MTAIDLTEKFKQLREPFKENEISKLPRPTKKENPPGKCRECGGWHGLPAIHLDYVGHAALTDRLLKVDPLWNWEPLAVTPDGLPLLDKDGGMWIKLTICGVTRLGYGDAQGKTGPNATKERIGDALRNAGMRFGLALDLWHKGELTPEHHEEEAAHPHPQQKASNPDAPLTVVAGGADVSKPDPAYQTSELTARRIRCLKTFKAHFAPDMILRCLPVENVTYYGENIHLGKTFEALSEEHLEAVEKFMADPQAPAKMTPKSDPTLGMSEGEKEAFGILSDPTDAQANATMKAIIG